MSADGITAADGPRCCRACGWRTGPEANRDLFFIPAPAEGSRGALAAHDGPTGDSSQPNHAPPQPRAWSRPVALTFCQAIINAALGLPNHYPDRARAQLRVDSGLL